MPFMHVQSRVMYVENDGSFMNTLVENAIPNTIIGTERTNHRLTMHQPDTSARGMTFSAEHFLVHPRQLGCLGNSLGRIRFR